MSDRFTKILPLVALAAAAGLVVLLGWQKRGLITQNEELARRLQEVTTQPVRGEYLPAFAGATLEGDTVRVGETAPGGRQVLLVYTTTCQFCLATIPEWKALAARLDTMRSVPVQVLGVSLDSAEVTLAYQREHALPYRTVRFPDEKTTSMWKAGMVPLTLVLDEQGRTIYSRIGEIRETATLDSIVEAVRWRPAPPPADSAAARTAAR